MLVGRRERRTSFDEEKKIKDGDGEKERKTIFRKVTLGKSSGYGNAYTAHKYAFPEPQVAHTTQYKYNHAAIREINETAP